jgi:hypothetical protein
LSALEPIEATIKIIDVTMGKDPWYLTRTKQEKNAKLYNLYALALVFKQSFA